MGGSFEDGSTLAKYHISFYAATEKHSKPKPQKLLKLARLKLETQTENPAKT